MKKQAEKILSLDSIWKNRDEKLKEMTIKIMANNLRYDEQTDACLKPIKERIEVLEKELNDLYDKANKLETAEDVIKSYSDFYTEINHLLEPTEPADKVDCECKKEPKSNNAFINLLKEFLNNVK